MRTTHGVLLAGLVAVDVVVDVAPDLVTHA